MTQIVIGKIGKPFGVQGWLVVHAYTNPISNLLTYTPWTLMRDDEVIHTNITPQGAEAQHDRVVVHFQDCHSPEQARAYMHCLITIDRSRLPPPEEGIHYWTDLIGLTVMNEEGLVLGQVHHVDNHGPHDLLYLGEKKTTYTIPYVLKSIVTEVDLAKGVIHVIWPKDATA
jgi:16S rRNA processing protein RimM